MRGRSPHNRPYRRKKDVYMLLLKLGGEARWKTLEANLKELGWGPTTLKRTLDQLVKEKTVIREARLGKKRAEVWYRTVTETDLLKPTIVWKPITEVKGREDEFVRLITHIRERAVQLDGEEKEIFLRDQLYRAIEIAMRLPVVQFLTSLRTADVKKLKEFESLLVFDYSFDYVVLQPYRSLFQLLLEYREYALEIMDQVLREPYKPLSVPPRSIKGFLESRASALQWIKSYGDAAQLQEE